jgi:hypothetical protein
MKQRAFSLLSVMAGVAGFVVMYQKWYIPDANIPLIATGVLGILYLIVVMRRAGSKNGAPWLLLALSLFFVLTAGAWIYEIWTFETILSAFGTMKISMIVLGTVALVLNLVHFTSQMANKKHNAQRTMEPAKQGGFFLLFKRKKEENTVAIILGEAVKTGRD